MVAGISGSSDYYSYGTTSTVQRPPKPPSFSELDTDSDGYITKSEFTTFSEKMSKTSKNNAGPKIDADELFSKIDSDGDGKISETEDTAFKSKMHKMEPKGPPPSSSNSSEDLFSLIDSNSDDSVDKTEFTSFLEQLSKKDGNTSTASTSKESSDIQSILMNCIQAYQSSSEYSQIGIENLCNIAA